jgi:competence protein ComEC
VDRGEFQADFLDVGQGLAVVIRTARHTLLYDAGFSNDSGFDVGRQVILPYLWHEGVSRLDRVVLSHDDRDHVGGYDSVARELTVGELNVMPGSRFLSRSSAARVCRAGEQWQWDGVDFSFLHPPGTGPTSENNRSCVLKITSRGGSVLLTGDIEKSVEDKLIKQYPDGLKTDVLLAPHHGSATSSSAGFIAATQPSEVVYAAGYRNRFGFPRPDVQQRYAMAGSQQWNTADTGMIRYRFTKRPGHFQRQHYRDTSRRIWQPATEHSPAK